MARIPGRTSACSRCHAQSTLPPRMARWVHRAHCLEPCRAGRCSDTCILDKLTGNQQQGSPVVFLFILWMLPLSIYHDTYYHKSRPSYVGGVKLPVWHCSNEISLALRRQNEDLPSPDSLFLAPDAPVGKSPTRQKSGIC